MLIWLQAECSKYLLCFKKQASFPTNANTRAVSSFSHIWIIPYPKQEKVNCKNKKEMA
jgi:hypothetical protein